MSLQDNNPNASSARSPADEVLTHRGEPVDHRLAHEFANLLDGSLRNLSLAIRELRGSNNTEAPVDDNTMIKLDVANDAMQQMADLMRRWQLRDAREWMHSTSGPPTLRDSVNSAVRLLKPAACARKIVIRVDVDLEAGQLPTGPLYPVIVNALRNAMEAIDALPEEDRDHEAFDTIEIAASVMDDRVVLTIKDTGTGIDPGLTDDQGRFLFGTTTKTTGHGLGLQLVRDVAESLGGSYELRNRSPRGAVLTVAYPTGSVMTREE